MKFQLSPKRIISIVIIVVIVIAVVFAGWYLALRLKPTALQSIKVYTRDVGNAMEIKLLTIPKEFSGKANYEIKYGSEVVATGTMNVKNGEGLSQATYDLFVVGNGDYLIEVEFKGVSTSESFNISHVVESITVFSEAQVDLETRERWIEVTIRPDRIPKDATAWATVVCEEIGFSENLTLTASETKDLYKGTIVYTTRGYYTINAVFINKLVKETIQITLTNTYPINTRPIADIGEDQTHTVPIGTTTYTVHFDASNSTDDGEIAYYYWDFGDGENATTEVPYVDHEYAVAHGRTYEATLVVQETEFEGATLLSEEDTCIITFYYSTP